MPTQKVYVEGEPTDADIDAMLDELFGPVEEEQDQVVAEVTPEPETEE